jgi:hypothetical protein
MNLNTTDRHQHTCELISRIDYFSFKLWVNVKAIRKSIGLRSFLRIFSCQQTAKSDDTITVIIVTCALRFSYKYRLNPLDYGH